MRLVFLLNRLLRRDQLDRSMEEEIQFHIAERVQDLRRSGIPAPDAERRAQLEFGNRENYKEQCRETRRFHTFYSFLADLRFGLRMLRRSPGFSILALVCLTLAIGANAAVFSWIEGTVLRPYPAVKDQERLFVLAGTTAGASGFNEISWPDFLDFQRNCKLIDSFIAEKIVGTSLNIGNRAEWAVGSVVSANYFDALGVRPILGRSFKPEENVGRNAHPVVVISYQLWKNRFNGDPEIIGKTQILNSVPYTIVGVAPKGFYGTFVGYSWQFWVPASMQEKFDASGYKLEDRGARWIEGFARLKPDVSAEEAQQEISAVARRLESDFPATNRANGIKLLPLWQAPFNNTRVLLPTLGIALAVVLLVLLIACANVANLQLVRSLARRHEMTVRLAVGASRSRLVKQLLTEGLILSALAGAGGLLFAQWCRNVLVLFMPPRGVPMYLAGEIDWRVVAFTAGGCLISTLLFGLVPAIQTSNVDIASALKAESGAVVGGRGRAWLRAGLVLVQVSLSFVLVVGAGLLVRSLQRIRAASPGFETQHVLLTAVNLFSAGYDAQRAQNFQDQLMDRVQALGGVESAAYARIAPFSYNTYSSSTIVVDGYQPAPDEQPSVEYDEVGPGYFSTLGIPVVSGREFTRGDNETAPPVAIVNETMAAKYWPGVDPVGRRIQVKGRWLRVIGVGKLSKYEDMLEAAKPFLYVPLRQNFSTRVALFIRTEKNPGAMATDVAREMHALDPDLAAYEVSRMREQIDQQTGSQQVAVMLLALFGGLALLLAAVGLYAVMSYAVSQSRRELGLRMALGAQAWDLLRLIMSRGLALTAAGIAVGAVAALTLTRLLGYLLYKVSPRDPLSFVSAFVVISIASLTACLLPAWRAGRIDPLQALRD